MRRPPLCDLTQVDPSLLTQRGSGSREPGESQQDGQDASGDSGGCACSRRRLRLPWLKGDSGRNGHYCTVPQVVRVSPGRENGTKRSLGGGRQLRAVVLPTAAHRCGNTRCARGRHQIPQQQTSASLPARTELREFKAATEGRLRRKRLRRNWGV